jgi:hypothetical protein
MNEKNDYTDSKTDYTDYPLSPQGVGGALLGNTARKRKED